VSDVPNHKEKKVVRNNERFVPKVGALQSSKILRPAAHAVFLVGASKEKKSFS